MSEVFNSSVLDAINRAVQDGISTTALEVDGTPQYCIINAETREIEIPGELNIFGVESDEKSTRVYFRCPKYVGTNVDLDMTQCMVYVPYRNANGEKDQYIVTDLNETENGENVEFTWLISRKASAYMGITEFGIRAIKTATGGTIEAEWNTTVASANVLRGMDVGLLEFSEENTDAIAQAVDLVKQEIELKGQEIIATIPDDYTTVAQNALSAKNEVEDIRVGADGIEYETAGEAVRGQIGPLSEDLDSIIEHGNNRYNGKLVEDGVINQNGIIEPNSYFGVTGYISVTPKEVLYVNQLGADGNFYSCYDSYKRVINTNIGTLSGSFVVPDDVYYMRFSCAKEPISNPYLSTVDRYEPYENKIKIEDKYIEEKKLSDEVVKKLNKSQDVPLVSGNNRYDGEYTEGYVVSNSDGNLLENLLWAYTEYMKVVPGDRMYTNFNPTFYACYNVNKEFVRTNNLLSSQPFTIPDNVYYIRCSISLNDIETKNNQFYLSPNNYFEEYKNAISPDIKIKLGSFSEIPIEEYFDYTCILNKTVHIGDSTTQGVYDKLNGSGYVVDSNSSYVKMFEKLCRCETVNLGQAGLTTQTYWDKIKELVSGDNSVSAVIISLGINDIFKNENKFNGSVEDVKASNYEYFPGTSAGSLGKIIMFSKEKYPNAKIFVCTLNQFYEPTNEVRTNVIKANGIIKEIANYLNCYLIDEYNESGMTYENGRYIYWGYGGIHFTKIGYAARANTIKKCMNRAIIDNKEDFLYINVNLND